MTIGGFRYLLSRESRKVDSFVHMARQDGSTVVDVNVITRGYSDQYGQENAYTVVELVDGDTHKMKMAIRWFGVTPNEAVKNGSRADFTAMKRNAAEYAEMVARRLRQQGLDARIRWSYEREDGDPPFCM